MHFVALFAAWAAVAASVGAREPAGGAKYEWDFSGAHGLEQVPWPKAGSRADDIVYHVTPRGVVRVKFPGGRTFERHVELVTFYRDGDQVSIIGFSMGAQSAADVHATATALAKEWGIDRRKLDEWKAEVDAGKDRLVLAIDPTRVPTPSVEVFHSFEGAKPYRITFMVGLMPLDREPAPATRPTTQPSTGTTATQPTARPKA